MFELGWAVDSDTLRDCQVLESHRFVVVSCCACMLSMCAVYSYSLSVTSTVHHYHLCQPLLLPPPPPVCHLTVVTHSTSTINEPRSWLVFEQSTV